MVTKAVRGEHLALDQKVDVSVLRAERRLSAPCPRAHSVILLLLCVHRSFVGFRDSFPAHVL